MGLVNGNLAARGGLTSNAGFRPMEGLADEMKPALLPQPLAGE